MAIRNVHAKVAAVVCAAALVLVGLGCDDDSTTPGTGTPTTQTGSGGGGVGGSPGGSGGTGAVGGGSVGGSGGGTVGKYGNVSGVNVGPSSTVGAWFVEADVSGTPGCTTTTQGDCEVQECTLGGGGAGTGGAGTGGTGAGGAPASPHAGDITVTGGVRDVTLSPNADGTYPVDLAAATTLFAGGETVTMAGAGAEVPAFSEALTAPSIIDLTAPVFSGNNLTVDTGSDLVLTWTSGTSGMTSLRLTGSDASNAVTVVCTWSASAGTGTATSAALAPLQGLSNGTSSINNGETVTASPGDWQVELILSALATQSAGMATGTATFN